MLSVLTPTGARPEAFARCVEQMQAQTFAGPVRWVIVDDGPEAMPTPKVDGWLIVHVRPSPLWEPGQNTQARNLLEGLALCSDRVAIIEDDDQYCPEWLDRVNEWLDHDDLVGEAPSVYRHLNGNEKKMTNTRHASLCATALKGEKMRRHFESVLRSHKKMIDVMLWKAGGKIYPQKGGVIGIKGYPGRPGIGVGHRL